MANSKLILSPEGFDRFLRNDLLFKFDRGMKRGAAFLSDRLSVDTGRMVSTGRSDEVVIEGRKRLRSAYKVGGLAVPGVYREQGKVEEVDYSIFVEIKTHNLRRNIPEFVDEVVAGMKEVNL